MGDRGYYFYNDTEPRMGFRGRKDFDPNQMYIRHYANWLELTFIARKTEGADRFQAEKELIICERKLEYWRKKHGWIWEEVSQGVMLLKRNWEVTGIPDRWSQR